MVLYAASDLGVMAMVLLLLVASITAPAVLVRPNLEAHAEAPPVLFYHLVRAILATSVHTTPLTRLSLRATGVEKATGVEAAQRERRSVTDSR